MLKVAYLHFPDDATQTPLSGWYVTDASGARVAGTGRFEHQAAAIRAASALINMPAQA